MHIAINAGGLGTGFAVADFQVNMSGFISDADSVISSFKTVSRKISELSGGIDTLQSAADNISARIRQEEAKKEAAITVQKKANDFFELAIRVDKQVATQVNQNKEAFYTAHAWLKPTVEVDDTPWYEDAWKWLCGAGEAVVEGAQNVWEWTKSTAKKAWDGLVNFYSEHWYEITNWGVTILCAAFTIVVAFSGGAAIMLIVGIATSAIIAFTSSTTTQILEKGTVDWGETLAATLIGAAIGAIGAGVGNTITKSLSGTVFGKSLLHSASTVVRIGTGAAIGSTSEVLSGMITRGTEEGILSLMEEGRVDFGDVWDAATNPWSIVIDILTGGISGGYDSRKAPISKEELDILGQKAVKDAWEKEVELVKQGKGTRDWTVSQQAELLEYGKVSGFEGQHMKSKAAYPEYAGDSANIQFLTYEEHFYGAHGQNFSNSTNGRFDPSTGSMIPFADGEAPSVPVIDLTDKYDPSQAEFLKNLGREFGYGRHEDIKASRQRIKSKN